jgi:RNA polymerase sigma-70 factor (ECF subfamily)
MPQRYRVNCLSPAQRPGNDELHALMAGALRHDRGESQKLFATVMPLFIAFYEGQVQAGRIQHGEIAGLVQQAFKALYLEHTRYDPAQPFRAWIVDIARSTLLDRSHAGGLFDPLGGIATCRAREALPVS